MASATAPAPASRDDGQSLYVASQWQLVWWRFRRHKLALAGLEVVAALYIVSLFPEFLAVYDPYERNAKKLYLSPTPVQIFDGWLPRPFVYGLTSARNPETLALEFAADTSKKYRITPDTHFQ